MRFASIIFLSFLYPALHWGADLRVPAGGDFQAALNMAQPGDSITLEAGAGYVGNFNLPAKTGSSFITIRGSQWQSLPAAGIRIQPAHFPSLPKLIAPLNLPVVAASGAVHHYRFNGVEFRPAPGRYLDDVIRCGVGESSESQLPYAIEFLHVYVHGDPVEGSKRGLAANCRALTVRDSYFSDFKSTVVDTQAIGGWNGPGPFTIVNNYLEATGENIAFGGAFPTIPGVIPSDIEIRGNLLFKPLTWKIGHPTYAGTAWRVKNHIEFKMGRRILIEGNLLENSWAQSDQQGFSVVLYPETNIGVTWATVEDITIRRNIFRYVQGGVNFIGGDPYVVPLTQQGILQRITVSDNIFEHVFWEQGLASPAALFRVVNGAIDCTIDHNTALNDGPPAVFAAATLSLERFIPKRIHFTNNIFLSGDCGRICGFEGQGTARGIPSLAFWDAGGTVNRNVMVGGLALNNPPVTYTPPTLQDVGFINPAGGNYQLAAGSPYRGVGIDGKDAGADTSLVSAAVAGVAAGNPPGSCLSISMSPLNATFPAAGGTGVVTISAPQNCAWTATPSAAWISQAASGTGNGSLTYRVAPLPPGGTRRAATITVGSRKVGISQLP
jgi:hypothetical protein